MRSLLLLLLTLPLHAAPDPLFALRDDASGKIGYVNPKMQWVIPPTWDSGHQFQENGLASVATGKDEQIKWGCIDRSGKTIIPLQYRWPVKFSEGLAPVCAPGQKDAPWGYLDETGRIVIAPRYRYAHPFSFRLAYVIEDNWKGYIDAKGNRKITVPPGDSADSFEADGLARILIGPGLFKFIDTDGREVCRSDQSPWKFNNSRCRVSTGRGEHERYGYIDRSGKLAIPMKYEGASNFNNGLTAVKLNGMWGYIDTAGQPVTPFHFDSARDFACGRAVVEYQGLWGVIDLTGKWIIQPNFAWIDYIDCDHRALAKRWLAPRSSKYLVVDESYVHDANPRKIQVPRELIDVLVADQPGLPRKYTGVEKLTPEQRKDTQAAFELVNTAKYDQAIPALETLHKQRVTPASLVLGRLHQLGIGVPQDPKKAYDCYLRPMLDQDPYAMYQVAQMHRTGKGQRISFDRMMMLAGYSAETGFAPANRLIAAMLLSGDPIEINPEGALQYIRAGVKANDPESQLALGICLERGLGTPADPKAAIAAYTAAGRAGLPQGHRHATRLTEAQAPK